MKKLLSLSLLGLSILAGGTVAEAKSANAAEANVSANAPQVRRWNRPRTVIRTTTVRRGRALFRETYRITYRPNGTVVRRLVSRVRIR